MLNQNHINNIASKLRKVFYSVKACTNNNVNDCSCRTQWLNDQTIDVTVDLKKLCRPKQ